VEHPPAQDETKPLSGARKALAWVTFALLLAIVLPWPA